MPVLEFPMLAIALVKEIFKKTVASVSLVNDARPQLRLSMVSSKTVAL